LRTADLALKRAQRDTIEPRLYISSSGHGSPCLDLRRVTGELADAAAGTDLVIIEGMGRAIHTNLTCTFT
jgi:type II pantothenate kinase